MGLSEKPLIDSGKIQARVAEIGAEISRNYQGRDLVLLVVLKGALVFAADLIRKITLDFNLSFIRARSYQGVASAGDVCFTLLPESSVRDRHILVVEDILDSGHTWVAIRAWLERRSPASIALCALLDKPFRRVEEIRPDYVGFVIDDHFVVGYGLDLEERYRGLPDIHTVE